MNSTTSKALRKEILAIRRVQAEFEQAINQFVFVVDSITAEGKEEKTRKHIKLQTDQLLSQLPKAKHLVADLNKNVEILAEKYGKFE